MQKGSISVQTENIFPIIKKFLYSDQEIFLRELVSNAVDATTKIKALANSGTFKGELGDTKIEIILDENAKTLTISDKGIGMDEKEVMKYLNQVAFSSAEEFLKKHKTESIIGHFGLGFYSAFMVADKVEVITKSYKKTAKGVTWTCTGDPEFTLDSNKKKDRGTDIVLHISEEGKEYLEKAKIDELLEKYCKFLPIEIKFGTKTETTSEGEGEDKTETSVEVDNIVNNPSPLWKKQPSELKDEDYIAFYKELHPFAQDPHFWIHLNIDFPFNLTGILYFPKFTNNFDVQKNKISLYSNQVYVTDNVKEIVPEFLTLLQGVIDSPDIPLNVSRSYLQSDRNVKQITSYITKKVASKLGDMFKNNRSDFEDKWKDIGTFVKYGMLTDEKFSEKAMKFSLLKSLDGKLHTIEEYKEMVKGTQTDKNDRIIIIYSNNLTDNDHYIKSAQNYGYDVVEFDTVIDNHFMQHLEQKGGDVTFVRVDSDTIDNLVQKDETKESVLSDDDVTKVKDLFTTNITQKEATVVTKALSPEDHPVLITRPEFMRRMKEMSAMQGMGADMGDMYNVVINTNNTLVAENLLKEGDEAKQAELCKHLIDLALLNQGMLKGEALSAFVEKSLNYIK